MMRTSSKSFISPLRIQIDTDADAHECYWVLELYFVVLIYKVAFQLT